MTDLYIGDDDLPQTPPPPMKRGRPKGTRRKKMNDVEKREFINDCAREILDTHMSYTQFVVYAKEKMNFSKSQANEYWNKIWSLLKKRFDMEKDKLILKHLHKYWDLYNQAIQLGDYTNARQALNDIAKLQGLNEPDKVHVTGTSIKLNFGEPNE